MTTIITEHTNDKKVLAGNCSRCRTYNEVWVADTRSVCHKCDNTMIHIHKRWPALAIYLIALGTILLISKYK